MHSNIDKDTIRNKEKSKWLLYKKILKANYNAKFANLNLMNKIAISDHAVATAELCRFVLIRMTALPKKRNIHESKEKYH